MNIVFGDAAIPASPWSQQLLRSDGTSCWLRCPM